jgi:RimJ/RimL family protein N-acetyltransferase
MPRTRKRPPVTRRIQVTSMPSLEEVRTLWDAMMADPDDMRYYWTSSSPQTWEQFLQGIGKTFLLLLGMVDGQVAGAAFLHHERAIPHTYAPHYAIVDLYVMKPFRGQTALQLSKALRTYMLETMGFQQLYVSVRIENRPCQQLMGALGMYRVGIVPRFLPVAGKLEDAVLYAAHGPTRDNSG